MAGRRRPCHAPQVPALPPPLTTRPLTRADARAVFLLMAAAEAAVLGEAEIEEADIVADWQRPGFVVEDAAVGVVDPTRPSGSELVGYAEVGPGGRCDAAVAPDRLGEGVGTWLAAWLRERGRALGLDEIGMPVPQGSPGDRLLAALGWRVRWTSWVLALPAGREVSAPTLPPSYAVRQARPDEHRALHAVVDDAFSEWGGRRPEDYADFEATVLRRPGAAPWNLRVVTHDGEVVAAVVVHPAQAGEGGPPEAYVARLAVRADHRGRGLAQALLADAFAVGRRHGCGTATLSTDSRTGALSLYEHVGMVVTATWVNRGTAP